MLDDGGEEVNCHEFLESSRDAERVEAQGELADWNEKDAIIGLFPVFDLLPHFVPHVRANEHIDGHIARLKTVFFGLDERLGNPNVAKIAYPFLLERRNVPLLLELLQSSNVRVVVADVLAIESVDQRHRHLQTAALACLKSGLARCKSNGFDY